MTLAPDNGGLLAFVKRDCPTCELVAPILVQLFAGDEALMVFSQDDPRFPAGVDVIDDSQLDNSWQRNIETVPTLIRVDAHGTELERIVGWNRDQWQAFTGIRDLGIALPASRPGCGSLSEDPSRVDELRSRMSPDRLKSRRVEIAGAEDEFEAMYDRGWSDGLPVVPPTPERVKRMLAGTRRDPADIVAIVPPDLVEATVEKVAINAVMAGCRPEYLPVVLASIEAVCTDAFNMHGILATTMSVGPILIVNGPIRHSIGMNSGINVFGQGNRANLTIGRAVQLIVRNVGGGIPGGVDRSTHGNPVKVGLAFAEDEEGSPWDPLAVSLGFEPAGVSTVTAFCAEGPHIITDQKSRSAESLTRLLAQGLGTAVGPRMVTGIDAMLVLSPEHMDRYRDAGWDRTRFMREIEALLQLDCNDIIAGSHQIEEGVPPGLAGSTLPKFRPGGLLVVHAGGPAGLFSSVFAGWLSGEAGSVAVTVAIDC